MPNVRQMSIEAYVERSGDRNRFGSGMTAEAGANAKPAAPTSAPVRAIVTVAVNPDGSLTAVSQKAGQEPEPSQPDRTPPRSTEQPPPADKAAPAETTKPATATETKAPAKADSPPAPQPTETKAAAEPAATHAAPPPPPPPPEPKHK